MPVQHVIDDEKKLITTIVSGEAADLELAEALSKYHRETRNRATRNDYNELLVFSQNSNFSLSTGGIRKIAQMATLTDAQDVRTRLAIVVNMPLAYGLGRMYEIFRSMVPESSKEVGVFYTVAEAMGWLGLTD